MSTPDPEFLRRLEEEFKRIKISDFLAQTVVTISQLGWQRLSGEHRDLDQARLAIEALRALVPVLEQALPEPAVRDFRQSVTNMQLAYAGAVAQAGPASAGPVAEPEPPGEQPAAGGEQPAAEPVQDDESPTGEPAREP